MCPSANPQNLLSIRALPLSGQIDIPIQHQRQYGHSQVKTKFHTLCYSTWATISYHSTNISICGQTASSISSTQFSLIVRFDFHHDNLNRTNKLLRRHLPPFKHTNRIYFCTYQYCENHFHSGHVFNTPKLPFRTGKISI